MSSIMVVINHFPKSAEFMPEYGTGVWAAEAKHIEVVTHAVGHSNMASKCYSR